MNPKTTLTLIAAVALSPGLATAACDARSADNTAAMHRASVLQGWDRRPGVPACVIADRLGRKRELDASGFHHDDLAPGARTVPTPAAYSDLWVGPLNAMRSAVHAVSDGPDRFAGERAASTTLECTTPLGTGDWTVTAIIDGSQPGSACADGRCASRHEGDLARVADPAEIAPHLDDRSTADMTEQAAADHPYVGLWVTADGRVRHRLMPNGRYVEARGAREKAYQGRYEVTGDHIEYWDDTGFTADGAFIEGVLHHAGMVLHRAE